MAVSHRFLACLLSMLPVVATVAAERPGPAGLPVVMTPQPGTPLERTARSLVAQDLAAARRTGDRPLLVLGSVRLGAASDRPALFVQLQSPRQCGSAGCSTSAFAWIKGRWAKVLDDASGRIVVLPTKRGGMSDLAANAERFVWNGTTYASARPVPAVDLRPHAPRSRHH